MNSVYEIARITSIEVMRMRVYQLLAAAIFLLPIIAIVFSNIFIFDIGKVRIDVLVAGSRLLITAYILLIAVTLLGRDIGQKACYQFLMPPVSRHTYLIGRFLGLLICMFILMLISMAIGELLISITAIDTDAMYQHGIKHGIAITMVFLSFYQYISLLALLFLICSWASGLAEMLIFSTAATFLTWALPPIIDVLQSAEVSQQVPVFINITTQVIAAMLPQLNGADIALALAHGLTINTIDITWHLLEHTSYACMMFALALIIFSRRDL